MKKSPFSNEHWGISPPRPVKEASHSKGEAVWSSCKKIMLIPGMAYNTHAPQVRKTIRERQPNIVLTHKQNVRSQK